LRASFNVSVAELDPFESVEPGNDRRGRCLHSAPHIDGLMKNVERTATRITNNLGAEITDSFVEYY
jgi:hypothetical protein